MGAFPVGASFLVVGTMKCLVLIGSKTLSVFSSAFFKEEVLSIKGVNWFTTIMFKQKI